MCDDVMGECDDVVRVCDVWECVMWWESVW